MIIVQGRIIDTLLLAIIIATVFYIMRSGRNRILGQIYRIPGLDAVDEAVGRAAEMGRPITFTTGRSSITHKEGASKLAAYAVMGYVSRLCASKGSEIYSIYNDPAELPLLDDVIRTAYVMEGKEDDYKQENLVYIPGRAMTLEYISLLERLNVATAFIIGYLTSEMSAWAEASARLGVVQISGTTSIYMIPYMVASCDYTMIGEEIFAAGAYLSKDRDMVNSIIGHDWVKYFVTGILIFSWLLVNTVVPSMVEILQM